MSKRWEIIQSGTARKHIKIRGNSIYVSNSKLGNVYLVDFSFKEIDSANETNTDSDPSVAQPA